MAVTTAFAFHVLVDGLGCEKRALSVVKTLLTRLTILVAPVTRQQNLRFCYSAMAVTVPNTLAVWNFP